MKCAHRLVNGLTAFFMIVIISIVPFLFVGQFNENNHQTLKVYTSLLNYHSGDCDGTTFGRFITVRLPTGQFVSCVPKEVGPILLTTMVINKKIATFSELHPPKLKQSDLPSIFHWYVISCKSIFNYAISHFIMERVLVAVLCSILLTSTLSFLLGIGFRPWHRQKKPGEG